MLPLVILLVSCQCPDPASKTAAVKLFNGRDLSGWTAVSARPELRMDAVWSVRDGLVVCKGEPLGYIQTDRKFTDFRLEVEWRWAPGQTPGNSGVFLRINGAPRPLPRCLEHQLKSGDAGDLYGFHGMKIDGDPARRVEVKNHELGGDFVGMKKLLANENPPGEWNRAEILADGPKVTTWINGRKVNEAYGCEVVAGPIGLQSEGGEIHFRTVRVTPLAR
jgi:hypothetical protein